VQLHILVCQEKVQHLTPMALTLLYHMQQSAGTRAGCPVVKGSTQCHKLQSLCSMIIRTRRTRRPQFEHLVEHQRSRYTLAAGVVENAVLLGAPVSIRLERWRMATSSVAGRFINGFSRRDWVLGVVYRGGNGAVH
jgi:Protein of unknown function (DUF726)